MKIAVKLKSEHAALISEMAHEAGTTEKKMVEIAIYNLIALWMQQRGKITPFDASAPTVHNADPVPSPE